MEKYYVIEDYVDGYYISNPDEYHDSPEKIVCECTSKDNARRIAKALASQDYMDSE